MSINDFLASNVTTVNFMGVEIFVTKRAVFGHFFEVTIAKINRKLKKNLVLMISTA